MEDAEPADVAERVQLDAGELEVEVNGDGRHALYERLVDHADGEGADVVCEAVGHPATVAQMVAACRVRGRILVGGIGGAPPVDLASVVFKELTLVGSRVYESRDMATALSLLGSGALKVDGLVTRTVPLEHAVVDGYQRLRDSRDEMKVLLAP